ARSTSPTLLPLPELPADAVRDLVLAAASDPPPTTRRPSAAAPPPRPTGELLAQLRRPSPEPVDESVRRAQHDRILMEILQDPDAAFRSQAVVYQDFLVRSRILGVPGEPLSLAEFRQRFAVAKAGIRPPIGPENDKWNKALAIADGLADEVRG